MMYLDGEDDDDETACGIVGRCKGATQFERQHSGNVGDKLEFSR